MILHCIFCDFKNDVAEEKRVAILTELSEFSLGLDGVIGFDFGPNRDFELKTPEYDAGFVIRFTDHAALEAYAKHPAHRQLGKRLCDLCNNGASGITVFDLDIKD